MGCERGEAICFSEGKTDSPSDDSTITPFGRAFYKRKASYFVIPYPILVAINILIAAVSASYWSISAVAAAQILRQLHLHTILDLELLPYRLLRLLQRVLCAIEVSHRRARRKLGRVPPFNKRSKVRSPTR